MNRQALVGAFVLGGLGLLVAAFILFGSFHPFTTKQHVVMIFQSGTKGLSVGAPVTFRGIQVGTVDRISIDYDPDNNNAFISVFSTLQPDNIRITGNDGNNHPPAIRELVARGFRAEVNMKSFVTGTAEIDLDFAPTSPATFHPTLTEHNTEIPTRQSPVAAITKSLTELPIKQIAQNAEDALAAMQHIADRLDQDLPPLVNSIRETSDHSRELVDSTRAMIEKLQPELLRTVDGIDHLTTTGTSQLNARGKEIHTLLLNANTTITKAGTTLDSLNGMTSTRSTERANLAASLRDIAAAASALRGFANDVERNPQLLLTGRHQ